LPNGCVAGWNLPEQLQHPPHYTANSEPRACELGLFFPAGIWILK
jgi:hypothetical protein